MKKVSGFLLFISLVFVFTACTPVDFDFNDPTEIEFIHDEFLYPNQNNELIDNDDMVELFGEENINFGPVPPSWKSLCGNDSICFKVDGMNYDTCIRFIFDLYHPGEIIPSHAAPPDYDASVNIHLFNAQEQCAFKHHMRTRDTYGADYTLDVDTAYIIGHDLQFTTYYRGKTYGNGNPTVVMIISGTMVFDTITSGDNKTLVFKGVKDYVFGKKILGYEYQPINAYAPGTIEIRRHPRLSPACKWNAQ